MNLMLFAFCHLLIVTSYVAAQSGHPPCSKFLGQCREATKNNQGIAISQCWGKPLYAYCKANDGTTFSIPGYVCQHQTCPSDANPSRGRTQSATPGSFKCSNGKRRIRSSLRCDGKKNCPDNSDEENCPVFIGDWYHDRSCPRFHKICKYLSNIKSNGVDMSECWGNGSPYTYCKAKDGTTFHIDGYICTHPSCPSDADGKSDPLSEQDKKSFCEKKTNSQAGCGKKCFPSYETSRFEAALIRKYGRSWKNQINQIKPAHPQYFQGIDPEARTSFSWITNENECKKLECLLTVLPNSSLNEMWCGVRDDEECYWSNAAEAYHRTVGTRLLYVSCDHDKSVYSPGCQCYITSYAAPADGNGSDPISFFNLVSVTDWPDDEEDYEDYYES